MINYQLLIHGPVDEIFLTINLNKWQKIVLSLSKKYPIIISTYNDKNNFTKLQNVIKNFENIELSLIYSEDLLIPGFYNINRQILLVKKGLENAVLENQLIIKLRMDQSIDFKKLFDLIERLSIQEFENKYLTTNCYTRKDRPYHPSDMLLVGHKDILENIYNAPYLSKTDLDTTYEIRRCINMGRDKFNYGHYWPESYLFRNFLRNNSWEIQETSKDSLDSLKKFIILINSIDVNLTWAKFENGSQTVLPYYLYNYPPFEGGPSENAICFYRSDFDKKHYLIEFPYRLAARFYWAKRNYIEQNKSKDLIFDLLQNLKDMSLKQFLKLLLPPIIIVILKGFLNKR